MNTGTRSSRAVALVLLLATGAWGAGPNPHLETATRLYQDLEFDAALLAVQRASSWPEQNREEQLRAHLLEGLISAQLGRVAEARAAFGRALAIDSRAQLPSKVSPKIGRMFEEARASAPPTAMVAARPPENPPSDPAPPRPSDPPMVAAPVSPPEAVAGPAHPRLGLVGGVLGLLNPVHPAGGSELYLGGQLGQVLVTARCRPGELTGLGVSAAYELAVGPVQLGLAARGDFYLGARVLGAGLGASGRLPVLGPVGVVVSASAERYRAPPEYAPWGLMLGAGLDVRL